MLEGWWVWWCLFPTSQMVMKKTLSEDVLVLDGWSHCGSGTCDTAYHWWWWQKSSLASSSQVSGVDLQVWVRVGELRIYRRELLWGLHVPLCVKGIKAVSHHMICDIIFVWSNCSRIEVLSFWWQLPPSNHWVICHIRHSQWMRMANL